VRHIGVTYGVVSDLSMCEVETAKRLVEADLHCSNFGIGYVYGQITVLGCKVHTLFLSPNATFD
jgi:hypothetical protein